MFLTIPGKAIPKSLFCAEVRGTKMSIILILAPCRLAFGRKHPNDYKRNFLDTDDLADRIDPSEKVIHDGLSQNANLRCPIVLLLGETSGLRRVTNP